MPEALTAVSRKMRVKRFNHSPTLARQTTLNFEAQEQCRAAFDMPLDEASVSPDEGYVGQSSNGCLLCNTIAELGAKKDKRTTAILARYLNRVENDFHAALVRAKALGEISVEVNVRERAKVLVAYSTGLLSLAKVLNEREMQELVRATVAALK